LILSNQRRLAGVFLVQFAGSFFMKVSAQLKILLGCLMKVALVCGAF
jgi:hypothetical protein